MTTQYIEKTPSRTLYFKDKEMTLLHREDGPAVEWDDGDKAWFIDGNRHRVDGPAVMSANGSKEWWINGKKLTEEEFNKRRWASMRMGG